MQNQLKLSIPSRHKTPEQQVQYQETLIINELYVRWINNQLVPGDEFLVIRYLDKLEEIKQQSEWLQNFHKEHMEWKNGVISLKTPPDEVL